MMLRTLTLDKGAGPPSKPPEGLERLFLRLCDQQGTWESRQDKHLAIFRRVEGKYEVEMRVTAYSFMIIGVGAAGKLEFGNPIPFPCLQPFS